MEPVDFFGAPNPLRSHLKAKLLSILGSADSDIDCTRELLRSGLKRLKLEATVEDVKREMRAHYYELKAQLKLCESGPPFPDAVTLDEFHSHCQPDHEVERINSEYTGKFYQLLKDMHADQAVSICCCVLSYCYDKALKADTESAKRADKTLKTHKTDNTDNTDNNSLVDIEEDAVVHVTSDEEEDSEEESEEDSDDESEELDDSDEDEESGENSEEGSEEEDESSASSQEGDEHEKGSPEDKMKGKMKDKKRQNTESSDESEEENERTAENGKGGEDCSSEEGGGDDDDHQAHEPHPKRKKRDFHFKS